MYTKVVCHFIRLEKSDGATDKCWQFLVQLRIRYKDRLLINIDSKENFDTRILIHKPNR